MKFCSGRWMVAAVAIVIVAAAAGTGCKKTASGPFRHRARLRAG